MTVSRSVDTWSELPPGVSVVVPVYDGTESIVALAERTGQTLGASVDWELIFTVDGSPDPVLGFTFLASLVSILAGAQLFGLGVIGKYLGRMHFRSMQRPTYVIRERRGRVGHVVASGEDSDSSSQSANQGRP